MQAAKNYRFGLFLVCCSVLLVSIAQLLLKNAVTNVQDGHGLITIVTQMQFALPLQIAAPLSGGLLCYGISVLIWQRALGELPLSIAYPLLSLSYPLVYLAALFLSGFTETVNPQRIIGLIFILIGITLLSPRSDASSPRPIGEVKH